MPLGQVESAVRLNSLETLAFQNGEIGLHAVAAGPKDGAVVVLLHGFPEFWYGWRKLIEPLAAAGFRVIVPDQRGYNLSSKPAGSASYALSELVSDVIAIADQLGQKKIFLVGHDWGAAVAWSAALLHPQRVAKLVVLNVPHPSVMRKFMKTRLRQVLRSWYIFFFQLPWLPETLLSAFHFRVGSRSLLRSSRVPTRILWGERDAFLLSEMAQESLRYCADAELYTFANAGHWLQHEEPARVSKHLIDFFRN